MNQAGEMTSNEVRDSLCLFAREVMPAVSAIGRKWQDDDTSWRVDRDTGSGETVLAGALS